MQLFTTDTVPEKTIRASLGMVKGNTIRARHLGRDLLAVIKMLFGGEVADYTKMMAESREQAIDRMCAEARSAGANAVVGVRFMTASMAQGAAEILVYGTAVIIADEADP